MGKLMLEERIKYPPFESYRFKPELLPIAIKKTEIKHNVAPKVKHIKQLETCHHHLESVVKLHGW